MNMPIIPNRHSTENTTTPASTRIINSQISFVGDVFSKSLIQVFSSHWREVYCGLNVPNSKSLEARRENLLPFVIQTNRVNPIIRHVFNIESRMMTILKPPIIFEHLHLFGCELKNVTLF